MWRRLSSGWSRSGAFRTGFNATTYYGSEFINHNLYGYCHDREIGFTRGRPYKKDDNAHIEQKNWTHVRKLIGWDRCETPGADRQKVEQLLHLRPSLDPFALSKIIRRKLERIWEMRHTGKRTVKSKGVSDMEISRSLSRTLSSPRVVSSSL